MKVSSLINKKSFIELSKKDQIDILSNLNEKKFRLSQINNWVFKNHVSNWREMKNFPLSLIEKLEKIIQVSREIARKPHKLIILKGQNAQEEINKTFKTKKYSYKLVNSITNVKSKIILMEIY